MIVILSATALTSLNLCVINIKGEADKVIQFLQGQITSDINKLKLNSCALSSVCNQKGQIVSDFIISSQEDGLKILVSKESAKLFVNDLEPYAKFFGVLFEPSNSKTVGFINMRSKKSMSFVSNDDYVLSIGIDESIDKNINLLLDKVNLQAIETSKELKVAFYKRFKNLV